MFFHAQGEAGLEMYMLLQGEVEVTRDGPAAAFPGGEVKSVPERLGFLSEGSFFGELPVLSRDIDAEIRTRTVTAVTYCKLAYLTRDDIAGLMKQYPVLRIRVNRFRNLCLRTLRRSGDVKRRKGQLLSDDDLIKAQVLANRAKVRAAIRARNSNEVRRVWSFPDLPAKLPKRGSVIFKRIVHWRGADDAALPKAAEHPAEGFEERVLETQAWRLWVRAHARRQVRTAAPQRSQQWRGALTRCYPPRAARP